MNIKLNISYDGTNFSGWQIQPNQRTVQNELQNAIQNIFKNRHLKLKGAGRTDSGVHANGQVANFCINTSMKESQIKDAINSVIPKDIYINSCNFENIEFDSRFSAKSRQYVYKINNKYDPFKRNYYWYMNYQIDFKKINKCADIILGNHDFQLFCKSISKQENNKCIVTQSNWKVEQDNYYYVISSNRFLHHMVRMLVGTMIEVGKGSISISHFEKMIDVNTEKKRIVTSPSQGLYLNKVNY